MWKTYMDKSTTKLPAVKTVAKKKWIRIWYFNILNRLKYSNSNITKVTLRVCLFIFTFWIIYCEGNCNVLIFFRDFLCFLLLNNGGICVRSFEQYFKCFYILYLSF
jgi:hypothetical protein